jgi:hypothetical protein
VAPMLAATALALFLELRAQPSLADLRWVPRAWVRFFDLHDFLKNAVAFGGWTATVHFALLGWSRDAWRPLARRAVFLVAFVAVMECAQQFLPLRRCDWRDIVAGGLGIGIASLVWLRFTPRSSHAS